MSMNTTTATEKTSRPVRNQGQTLPSTTTQQSKYFVPGDPIAHEVISADICRYLGNDALVRPSHYEDPRTGKVVQGYVLNLVVKALLFGHKAEAFEAQMDGAPSLDAVEHEIWRKKGPIGKLHNLVHWIHRSDKLTYRLRALQEEFFRHSDNPKIQARNHVDVVLDNQTRWLSNLYMMRLGLMLQPFLEDLLEKVTLEFNKGCRSGTRRREEMPFRPPRGASP